MTDHSCRKCGAGLTVGVNWLESLAKRNNRICRPCSSQASKDYAAKNPDYHRDYRKANRDRINERNRAAYAADPEATRERKRAAYAADPEATREKGRRSRRAYCARHPDRVREQKRKSAVAGVRRWRLKYPEKARAASRIHNSRRRVEAGRTTACDFEKALIRQVYGDVTVVEALLGEKCQVDHVVPLAKGGRHEYANLQILTARDNASKGARTDWKPKATHEAAFRRVAYAVQRGVPRAA